MPSKNYSKIIINDTPYYNQEFACKQEGIVQCTLWNRIHRETTAMPPSSEFTIKSGGKKFRIKLVKGNNDKSD